MKLAVIFLSLTVANFIGTSKQLDLPLGGGGSAVTTSISSVHANSILNTCLNLLKQYKATKNCGCDKAEQEARNKVLCEGTMDVLKSACKSVNKSVMDMLTAAKCTTAQIKAILNGTLAGILAVFFTIFAFLVFVFIFVQSVFCLGGVVLHAALSEICKLQDEDDLLIDFKPHLGTTIEGCKAMVPGGLATFLGTVGFVVAALLGILGSLLNGLFGGCKCP